MEFKFVVSVNDEIVAKFILGSDAERFAEDLYQITNGKKIKVETKKQIIWVRGGASK